MVMPLYSIESALDSLLWHSRLRFGSVLEACGEKVAVGADIKNADGCLGSVAIAETCFVGVEYCAAGNGLECPEI